MAQHTDPCCLHNLAYHPRWEHNSKKGRKKRHIWTDTFSRCSHFESFTASSLTERSLSSKPQLPSSPVQHTRGWWRNWFLWPFLIVSFFPYQACATTFTMALVGPWTCDLLYSKALPDLAATLAINRINKNTYLNKGYWYDYKLINEDCQSSRALARFAGLKGYGAAYLGPANAGYCSSAALYAKEWDLGLLSWACLKSNMNKGSTYPTFMRPLPLSTHVIFTVLRYFRWAHVAIISEESDVWESTGQELGSSLRALGLAVKPVVTMENNKEGPRKALSKVREADRVRGESHLYNKKTVSE